MKYGHLVPYHSKGIPIGVVRLHDRMCGEAEVGFELGDMEEFPGAQAVRLPVMFNDLPSGSSTREKIEIAEKHLAEFSFAPI